MCKSEIINSLEYVIEGWVKQAEESWECRDMTEHAAYCNCIDDLSDLIEKMKGETA